MILIGIHGSKIRLGVEKVLSNLGCFNEHDLTHIISTYLQKSYQSTVKDVWGPDRQRGNRKRRQRKKVNLDTLRS